MMLALTEKQLLAMVYRFQEEIIYQKPHEDTLKIAHASLMEVWQKLYQRSLFPAKTNKIQISYTQGLGFMIWFKHRNIHGSGLSDNLLRKIINSSDQKQIL